MNKWRKLDSLGSEREFDLNQIHFRGIRASRSRGIKRSTYVELVPSVSVRISSSYPFARGYFHFGVNNVIYIHYDGNDVANNNDLAGNDALNRPNENNNVEEE